MEFIYLLNNQIITKEIIKNSLQLFWIQIVKTEFKIVCLVVLKTIFVFGLLILNLIRF